MSKDAKKINVLVFSHILYLWHLYWIQTLTRNSWIHYTDCIQTLTKKLVNSLHRLYTNIDQETREFITRTILNCEIGGLDCRVITAEYRTRVQCIHMYHLFCNALVHVIYSIVSGQYSYTIVKS